jgi:hypothetical protein
MAQTKKTAPDQPISDYRHAEKRKNITVFGLPRVRSNLPKMASEW